MDDSFADCCYEQRATLAARIFFIFVPSLGLSKTTARVGCSSSNAEKKAVRRDGGRKLIAYSTPGECICMHAIKKLEKLKKYKGVEALYGGSAGLDPCGVLVDKLVRGCGARHCISYKCVC